MTKTQTQFKNVQSELKESVHKVWLAGLGALSTAEEEGRDLFNQLVDKGEKFEARGRKRIEEVKDRVVTARERAEQRWERLGEDVDDRVQHTVERLGVPSRDEIQKLTRRVEELNRKIESMVEGKPASTKTRKTA